ncbi:hypothetical protein GPECTOR_1g324 [Gonium pectorale]|uniref:Uncharacterized protein n=1 Tax=Gonium pectorale TaxID=33097 RepID=A0A150H2G8_GONPE|nr:hypothetical protein GPECTOR_1g324 [Gonium pectorale]|eukprot:KXZ56366.1 hypothetical protein GPECTOR_1g324 [Gonium pectorale]
MGPRTLPVPPAAQVEDATASLAAHTEADTDERRRERTALTAWHFAERLLAAMTEEEEQAATVASIRETLDETDEDRHITALHREWMAKDASWRLSVLPEGIRFALDFGLLSLEATPPAHAAAVAVAWARRFIGLRSPSWPPSVESVLPLNLSDPSVQRLKSDLDAAIRSVASVPHLRAAWGKRFARLGMMTHLARPAAAQ